MLYVVVRIPFFMLKIAVFKYALRSGRPTLCFCPCFLFFLRSAKRWRITRQLLDSFSRLGKQWKPLGA